MTRHITHIIILAAALLTALSASAQPKGRMTVKAQADSTVLEMGDRTAVTLQVVKNGHPGALLDMPQPEKDYYGLEMVEYTLDSTEVGNGRVQLDYRFTFQAFYPEELLTLPPFRYAQDGDTAASDILTFKVYPVPLSPELGDVENVDSLTIHPDEQPMVIKARWYDSIPDWLYDYWWLWLLGILLVAALIVVLVLYKRNGPGIFVPRKVTPPYELAMMQLEALKQRRLLEKGQPKAFYTEVVDILRRYLHGRFGINAMEMTSKQIVRQIRQNKETHMSASQIEQTLQIADIVKFAAQNPTPDEGQRTFQTILRFVEMTRPVEEPEGADKATASPATDKAAKPK